MLHQAILLTTLLGNAPDSHAPQADPAPICVALPPAPEHIDSQPFTSTATGGSQAWGSTATYRLSTGETGEAFMLVNSDASGEAQLMVDGEIIAHVAVDWPTSSPGPIVTTWYSPSVSATPEAIAEMMRVDLPLIVADQLPQEFKCSDWGRKVMKAGKYMALGLIGAGAAACCIASQGFACVACGGASMAGGVAVVEFADGYCD